MKKSIIAILLVLVLASGMMFAYEKSMTIGGAGITSVSVGAMFIAVLDEPVLGWTFVGVGGAFIVVSIIGLCTDDFYLASTFESDPVLQYVKLEENEKGLSMGLKFDL